MNDESETTKTWLVFIAGEKKYALLSSDVQEILRDAPVFPLPFVPAYINGVLNRYGEPYAVIDPLPLLGEKTQSSKLYIVLHGNAHLCLRISEVIEFFPSSESGKYYIGSFDFKSEEVLILNPEAFVEVAERDAGNA